MAAPGPLESPSVARCGARALAEGVAIGNCAQRLAVAIEFLNVRLQLRWRIPRLSHELGCLGGRLSGFAQLVGKKGLPFCVSARWRRFLFVCRTRRCYAVRQKRADQKRGNEFFHWTVVKWLTRRFYQYLTAAQQVSDEPT